MNSRSNLCRRQAAAKARQDRTIVAYIELKCPEAYNEAVGYYNTLNQRYPTKLDLRKTEEFHALKASVSGQPLIKKKTKKTYVKTTFPSMKTMATENTTKGNLINDNMELKIELISPSTTSEPYDKATQDDIPTQEIEQLMAELKKDPLLASFFTSTHNLPPIETPAENCIDITPNITEVIPEPPIETPVESCIDITPSITEAIPQGIVDEIISDLEKEPDLESIFNEMDIGMDIEIGIEIPETSPLEQELLKTFY